MKLEKFKITNYRGYRDTVTIEFSNLTTFVGKNDIGKSTVLEALDVFFNDKKAIVPIEKNDINVSENELGNTETILHAIFSEVPGSIIIDSVVETSLESEWMLNEDGFLEIVKKYNNAGTPKVFIRALHPSNDGCTDLLLKKNNELKKIIADNHIICENQSVNAILRSAIWNHYSDNLQLQMVDIDVTKEDAKKIWDKLSNYLPTYSLFQSDRKNNDGDSLVQDPLKEAVKQILNDEDIKAKLNEIAVVVQNKLQDVSDRTLEKLNEMDSSIASSLNPIIPETSSLKWNDVFKNVSISGDQDIPINKRGSGVKRLVLLNFFRAEAERRLQEGDSTGIIYAIEEPETSQHTANQIMLIEALKSLADAPNSQVIITTHSSNVVKRLQFDNIRLIFSEDDIKNVRNILPGQLNYPSLNEVNYIAFGEVTEEYHDELFNYIEYQQWKQEYFRGKPQRPYIQKDNNGNPKPAQQKTLTEIIRHQIHHADNQFNPRFTKEDLAESIAMMRDFLEQKRESGEIYEPDEE